MNHIIVTWPATPGNPSGHAQSFIADRFVVEDDDYLTLHDEDDEIVASFPPGWRGVYMKDAVKA